MNKSLELEIAVLQEISSAVVHERDVEALLNKILAVLHKRMGMLRGTFTLRQGDILSIEASHGLDEQERQRGRYHIGEGITGHVAERGIPHIVPDISKDKRFLNRTGTRTGQGPIAFICVPIVHLEQVIGTLSIDRQVDGDTDLARDCKLLEIVGNIAAEAVAACIKAREERESLLEENRQLRSMLANAPGGLIGNSPAMAAVYEQIRQAAPSDATILIRGKSGTGKELVARAIVQLSPRANKPFVALNCAALPENLVESELFGHEKGAFTGAVSRRVGRAELADGGTLFLDEVGDLSLSAQAKLLRFIQERTFSRVGSSRELHADVRFLAATSRDLEDLMAQKLFREDLYYRLNIFPIYMPDLAERQGDIVQLAEHFIRRMNARYNKTIKGVSASAVNLLTSYHWPGNVRELENCIERAVLTCTGDCIHSCNLPPSLQNSGDTPRSASATGRSLKSMLESCERELIVDALRQNQGNMSAAARALGISPRVMHYKIAKLNIPSAHGARKP